MMGRPPSWQLGAPARRTHSGSCFRTDRGASETARLRFGVAEALTRSDAAKGFVLLRIEHQDEVARDAARTSPHHCGAYLLMVREVVLAYSARCFCSESRAGNHAHSRRASSAPGPVLARFWVTTDAGPWRRPKTSTGDAAGRKRFCKALESPQADFPPASLAPSSLRGARRRAPCSETRQADRRERGLRSHRFLLATTPEQRGAVSLYDKLSSMLVVVCAPVRFCCDTSARL